MYIAFIRQIPGSKMEIGSEIYSDNLHASLSLRSRKGFLGGHYYNPLSSKVNKSVLFNVQRLLIYEDSLTVIKTLKSNILKSKCLYHYIHSLDLLNYL